MNTVQTNVRVPPDAKPIIRTIAARLRSDKHFRDRLQALLADEPSPALEARIARLEAQMRALQDGTGAGRTPAAASAEAGLSRSADPVSAD